MTFVHAAVCRWVLHHVTHDALNTMVNMINPPVKFDLWLSPSEGVK